MDKYPMYHLYAVVVHLGVMNGAYSGHYVSYVKNFQGQWFRIDDSRVSYHIDSFSYSTWFHLFSSSMYGFKNSSSSSISKC